MTRYQLPCLELPVYVRGRMEVSHTGSCWDCWFTGLTPLRQSHAKGNKGVPMAFTKDLKKNSSEIMNLWPRSHCAYTPGCIKCTHTQLGWHESQQRSYPPLLPCDYSISAQLLAAMTLQPLYAFFPSCSFSLKTSHLPHRYQLEYRAVKLYGVSDSKHSNGQAGPVKVTLLSFSP